MAAMVSWQAVVQQVRRRYLPAGLLLLSTGCATQPPAPVAGPDGFHDELAYPPTMGIGDSRPESVPATSAVAVLLKDAATSAGQGDLEGAARILERSLRIEPRNPLLWSRLAGVRLRQGQLRQAEQLALKSNLFAANDLPLQVHNWRLIAAVRNKRGDARAAAEAEQRAEALRQGASDAE